ncbi:hypothetical protein QVD17_18308 [Tagetes erecta]|uniref:Protein kinase domain-containing protein n=1 Tax=Tagetes erecta TaxID=13708 RepID=A0AAD8NNV6_TARER|nr:hypothetical protein QVD17_18308 [Tagetes erecta]
MSLPLFFVILLLPLHVISQNDQTILLNLKRFWSNPIWLSHWNQSSNPCNWPEISCTNTTITTIIIVDKLRAGTIPSFICDLKNITHLHLSQNQLTGQIPHGFWNLKSLTELDLRFNKLSGELPRELGPSLSTLMISNNRFTGQIPFGVSSWTSLRFFDAGFNQLHGAIPQELTSLSKLQTLSLEGNRLTGEIPEHIISWTSLYSLNLAGNKLTGQIPVGLAYLEGLTLLDLSRNHLSGEIPSQLARRHDLRERIFLNNPGLCSDEPLLRLESCHSLSKPQLSVKLVAIIASTTLAVVLMLLIMIIYLRRKYVLYSKWKFIYFQRLNFTKSNILQGLTERNLIGEGGSGKVYRIQVNTTPGKFVAVKKISTKKDLDQRLDKEFLAEAKILSMIRHSNIVKLMGCVSCDTSKLLVYEYLENMSLDHWLHRKQASSSRDLNGSFSHLVLDWPKRMHIALGVARGLTYMHHDCLPGILHRDVKSSNVLLDSEFNAKIADFGLARILAKESELNTMSTVAGSFGYIAPEYAYTNKVNEKVDVYSFGVILLELTTGKEANNGDEHSSLADWAWQQALADAPIVDALDNKVKDTVNLNEMTSVYRLGLWCTSKLPTDRPSMKEVCQKLLCRRSQHG